MKRGEDNLNGSRKAERVRSMFAEIAPRYDLLNHLLSLNIDRRWRRFTIRKIIDSLNKPGTIALDLCCGTADLSIELARYAPTIGLDFCHPMLQVGKRKTEGLARPIQLVEGDALRIPSADEAFGVVTIAFGLRNLESVEDGLREIYRVLRREGRAAILEFSRPRMPVFRGLFNLYFTRLLPRIGGAISGSQFAYQYLPESVREFPDQERLRAMMEAVGFSRVRYYNLFGGVAALHLGEKQ
ncbi:MAG TPA: bifunctional demethylmenaquinone methyltransferase/2-methoxy-6-polyprenyl-1,4-benzoquinol methylase UbiE [Blastocatellia bacterium]|nr:bifunctional demethylmenaquinone methyltransferase/2-methoxy-6-polyprenyl-1,4-benzoquinol methylase UbiE [Blastocatellia bacterium]